MSVRNYRTRIGNAKFLTSMPDDFEKAAKKATCMCKMHIIRQYTYMCGKFSVRASARRLFIVPKCEKRDARTTKTGWKFKIKKKKLLLTAITNAKHSSFGHVFKEAIAIAYARIFHRSRVSVSVVSRMNERKEKAEKNKHFKLIFVSNFRLIEITVRNYVITFSFPSV